MIRELHRPQETGPTVEPLTERETQVLQPGGARTVSNQEIAGKLVISERDGAHPREQHPGQAAPGQSHPGRPLRVPREGLAKLDAD